MMVCFTPKPDVDFKERFCCMYRSIDIEWLHSSTPGTLSTPSGVQSSVRASALALDAAASAYGQACHYTVSPKCLDVLSCTWTTFEA